MTPGMMRNRLYRSHQLSIPLVDTYGAQVTVQEVNKGITNHKVRLQTIDFLPTLIVVVLRIWNHRIPHCSYSATEMVEVAHYQRCWKA